MTKQIVAMFLAIALLAGEPVRALGDIDAGPYEKQAQAIQVLQAADRAIRKIRGLSYRAEYLGAFTSRGRVSSDVLLRRGSGADEVMQTIAYAAKIEVEASEAPYAQEHYPQRYTVIEIDGETRLVDPAERTIELARGQDRWRLNYGALTSGILPQYTRPEPLQFEIEESLAATYLGTIALDGVESHVVWLKFPDQSGYGEQMLYFGVDDKLLRKATLVVPEAALPDRPGAAPASNPSIFMELTLREIEVLPELTDAAFHLDDSGFNKIVLGGESQVGDHAPDWSLPLAAGGQVSSADLRGTAVVLYFWASWCPTCHRHMPAVQDIHDSFADRARVLAVNAFDRDDALAHIRARGYTFEVALEGDSLLSEVFGFPGQPALIVIDRDGIVRYRALAEDPADEALWELLRSL